MARKRVAAKKPNARFMRAPAPAPGRVAAQKTVPCPRCAKQVPVDPVTGNWVRHDGQVTGSGKTKSREMPCKASGIQGAIVRPDGSLRIRDKIDVQNDIDRRLGGAGDRKSNKPAPDPDLPSNSVRTVSAGLPGHGKRRS